MNKTYKSGMMALSAVAFFTSCSESESLQQAHLSTDQINFIASMAHQWDANDKSAPQYPSSRSAGVRDNEAPIHVNANLAKPLYLHPVVQDGIHIWSKQGTPITRSGAPIEDVEQERVVQTRGSMKNNLSDYTSFNVSAVNTHDNPESLFFGYQKAASVTSNSTTTWHVPDGINCWPEAPATLSFYAYAPDNSMVTVKSGDDAAGVKTVHYKAETSISTVKDQPDLIVSSNTVSRTSNAEPAKVNLPFYHALTAVTFSVDAAMMPGTLTKVELVNVNTEGDCTMTASATPSFSWSNQKTPSTFSFDFDQPVGSSAVTLTSDEKTLMMVPQELPADAEVKFTFTVNGVSQTLSAPIGGNGKQWEAGKSIIYKLSTKTISTISAANVSFPTTWNDTETVKVSYPKSTFDNGESIGLYVVEKDTGKLVGKNIKLTKNTDGWKLDGNDKFMLLTRYNYFAYYPYSPTDPTDPTVTTADETATEFFTNKISNWNPAKNQSSELLSQDLQVAKGVIEGDGSTLKFPMEHCMGLAVLNLEKKSIAKTRRFYNNSYTYYYPDLPGHATTKPTEGKDKDYTNDAATVSVSASTNFSGNIPYKTSTANRYLQIVKPSSDLTDPSTGTSFKASDKSPRSAWGTLTPYTFNVARNAAMSRNIQTDADFYYLARVYTCTQSVANVDWQKAA